MSETMTKCRPIPFSGPMVRAIIDGRKTQTRRVVKPSNSTVDGWHAPASSPAWTEMDLEQATARDKATIMVALVGSQAATEDIHLRTPRNGGDSFHRVRPRWEEGDPLRVNESYRVGIEYDSDPPRDVEPVTFNGEVKGCTVWYEADGKPAPESGWGRLRPGRFMMGWMSRLTLEVVRVRVERVQDISDADARAESFKDREDFFRTFYDLNKRAEQTENPWVWAVAFKHCKAMEASRG